MPIFAGRAQLAPTLALAKTGDQLLAQLTLGVRSVCAICCGDHSQTSMCVTSVHRDPSRSSFEAGLALARRVSHRACASRQTWVPPPQLRANSRLSVDGCAPKPRPCYAGTSPATSWPPAPCALPLASVGIFSSSSHLTGGARCCSSDLRPPFLNPNGFRETRGASNAKSWCGCLNDPNVRSREWLVIGDGSAGLVAHIHIHPAPIHGRQRGSQHR
jgi:hypothetical protein